MTEQLTLSIETPPIAAIKAVVDVLADLGIDPLHLHVDGSQPTDSRPNLSVWCRYRTDFERVCQRLQLKATERRYVQPGQRHWYAARDDDTTRLLIQCVSLQHHADWEPRPTTTSEESDDDREPVARCVRGLAGGARNGPAGAASAAGLGR